MATSFKVQCDQCGFQQVPADGVLVVMAKDPAKSRYTFQCPECMGAVARPTSPAQAAMLTSHGARWVQNFDVEGGSKGTGPITADEVKWFSAKVGTEDHLAEAVKLWEVSGGTNWTTGQANGTEGAGGQGQDQ